MGIQMEQGKENMNLVVGEAGMERRRAVNGQMKGRVNLGKGCQCYVTWSRVLGTQQERVSESSKEQAGKRMWSKRWHVPFL